MTIKSLQKICHKIAVEKGFWDITCKECGNNIVPINIKGKLEGHCHICGGISYSDRNNGELIALMHSELSEALEDLRRGKDKHVGSEFADCVIRIMDFCGGRKIDLQKEILKKIKKNKKRPYKHGKRF